MIDIVSTVWRAALHTAEAWSGGNGGNFSLLSCKLPENFQKFLFFNILFKNAKFGAGKRQFKKNLGAESKILSTHNLLRQKFAVVVEKLTSSCSLTFLTNDAAAALLLVTCATASAEAMTSPTTTTKTSPTTATSSVTHDACRQCSSSQRCVVRSRGTGSRVRCVPRRRWFSSRRRAPDGQCPPGWLPSRRHRRRCTGTFQSKIF